MGDLNLSDRDFAQLNISKSEFEKLRQDEPELIRRLTEKILSMRGLKAEDDPNDPGWVDPWEPLSCFADARRPRPRTTYLVDHLLPIPSLSMIYGPPGCLKSMLAMDLAVCVASGKPWLEASVRGGPAPFKTEKADVLWLDLDQGGEIVSERLRALGIGHKLQFDEETRLFWVSMPRDGFDLENPLHLGNMMLRMHKHAIKLLFIDNLGMSKGSADENTDDMIPVLNGLRNLAEAGEAAVVVLHHSRKENGFKSQTGDLVRGHSSINGGLDLALKIERDGQSPQINVRIGKMRRRPVKPFGALFTFDNEPGCDDLQSARFFGEHIDSTGPTLSQLRSAERRDQRQMIDDTILECIGEQELGQKDVVEAVQAVMPRVGINLIRNRLARLVRYGRITARRGEHNRESYVVMDTGGEEE